MISYQTLFLLFAISSTLLSATFVLMTRLVHQIKEPPKDSDFERLLSDKASLETQLAQEQNLLAELRSQVETLENDLKQKTAELEAAKITAATGS